MKKNKINSLLSTSIFCLTLWLSLPAMAMQDSSACMSQILSKRYSGYKYDASRLVAHEQLKEIIEAGRLAPSSYNQQPWNFIICDRSKNPEAFKKVLGNLVEFNQGWAKNALVLIISIASNKSAHNGESNRWGPYDTGAAAFAMMLKATSMGLMAHQMGGFDESKIRQEFFIPENFEPMSVMAIGYPSSEEVQPERKRRPLSENFFEGSWGKSFQ